ncbi:MAG: class I SAM-dependent methyltransferase [Leptospiraceae bacterium]|nr:class I SAM-dependent methyltransferase [Leptospiraceae bacterium]
MPSYSEHDRYNEYEQTHWWFVARRNFLASILARHNAATGSVIEFGTGTGYNLVSVFSKFSERTGVDINPRAVEIARTRGLNVIHSAIADYEGPAVDLVAFLDVLYHKKVDVDQALRKAHNQLKPGGRILIFDGAFDLLEGRQSETVESARRFKKGALSEQVRSHGFEIEEARYWGLALFFLMLLKRKILDRFQKADDDISFFANGFFLTLMKWENWLASRWSLPFGASIVLLARRT